MKTKFLITLLAVSSLSAQEGSVGWGTSNSFHPDHIFFTSDGVPDTTTAITWNIGWFNDGFTPTASNYNSWVDNYNPVDNGFYDLKPIAGTTESIWSVDEHYDVNELGGEVGKQIWVFALNDASLIGTSSGEALLYSDGQLFNSLNEVTADIFDHVDGGGVDDDNFTLVWGNVDRMFEDPGGVLTGGGVFSNQLGDGVFEAQTATWAVVVPEPSSTILLALGGLGLLSRRKR